MLLRLKLSSCTSVALMLFSVGISVPVSALAEDACSKSPDRMNMVIQLTGSGQQKLSKIAYETGRRKMDEALTQIPKNVEPFGADPEKCKRPNIDKLTPAEIDSECFGLLPEALWNGDLPDASMSRLEPVRMKMDNLELKHAALSKSPNIQCKNNVCEVSANIDELNLGFDISAKSVNESCDMVGLNGVKVDINSKTAKSKPANIRFKMRFTDNVARPIEVDWDSSKFDVPVQTLKYRAQSVTRSANLCKRNQSIQKAASAIVEDLVAKNQHVMNMILDTVQKSVIQSLVDEQIIELARANGFGKDTYVKALIPSLKSVTTDKAIKSVTQEQVNKADQYLKTVMTARSGSELSTKLQANQPGSNVTDYVKNLKNKGSETALDLAGELAKKWQANAKELSKLASSTRDPQMKVVLQSETNKIQGALKELESFQHDVKLGLEPTDDGELVALTLTAIQANNLQSEIQAKVSACYRCSKFDINARAGAEWGFEKGNHDIAFKTGYGTVNQVLAKMHQKNGLDLCIIENADRDCKDAQPNDGKVDVHFTNAPVLFWDDESGTFAIKVKQIQLTNQKLELFRGKGVLGKVARKMEADVILPGVIRLDKNGKGLHFEPFESKIRVSNPEFKAAEWDRTKILSGIVAWVGEKVADTGFTHHLIREALTMDVDMPDAVTLTQLKISPEGLGVYVKLPDNPLELLPAEKPARTLAATANKTKLK